MAYRSTHYRDDPRTIEARFPATCGGCSTTIVRGNPAVYYPKSRTMLCNGDGPKCGKQAMRDFHAAAADEAMLGG